MINVYLYIIIKKVGILQRRKAGLLIFLNIKVLAKRNKIELSGEFMAMSEKNIPSGISCSHYIQRKMRKTKV